MLTILFGFGLKSFLKIMDGNAEAFRQSIIYDQIPIPNQESGIHECVLFP